MSRQISRDKYENLKLTAYKWRDQCEKLKDKILIIQDMEADLDKLEDEMNNMRQENESLKNKIKTRDTDRGLLEELENENKVFQKLIRSFKKEKKELLENNQKKISELERDILLKDGKIQSLQEAKEELRERYNELKEDFRELRRWNIRE